MTVPPESLPPRPGPLAVAVGVVRVASAAVVLAAGTAAVLAASLWPGRAGRVGPAERVAQGLARALLAVAGVRRRSLGDGALARHRGFVFFNHVSYLDPLVLVAAAPMRFLAAAGVRRLPLVGWAATALGTVYVDRGRSASRTAARRSLGRAVRQSPVPVALAPEGRIGPGPGVLPLRRGAFEVAADARAPIRLVGLRFEPPAYAVWQDGEGLARAFWRLCARTAPMTAVLTVLDEIPPHSSTADVADRAVHAESLFNQGLHTDART